MKDILVAVEMLRDHDVTAEVKLIKLLEKNLGKKWQIFTRGNMELLKY